MNNNKKKGTIMPVMIGDEYRRRTCITCKEIKSEPAEWWEFVSLSCQPCEEAYWAKQRALTPRFEEGEEPF